MSGSARTPAAVARVVMSLFYLAAGVAHLLYVDGFVRITPNWVPFPAAVIVLTGACELAGAVGLWIPRLRWLSGLMLGLYAVCVFPANIHHALDHVDVPGLPSSWWYHAPRLAMQPVLVWAALLAGRVVAWPWRAASARRLSRS